MPRGGILLIDLIISFVSVKLAFILVATITNAPIDLLRLGWPFWTILGVQLVFFLVFKSYMGLVRYSNFRDAINLLKETAACVLALLLADMIYLIAVGEKAILDTTLVIYGIIAFLLLFLFRVTIKRIYEFISLPRTSHFAYVLGTAPDDVAMASGLISQNSTRFSIAGFVDDQPKSWNKRVFNLPIYSLKTLQEGKVKADAIIVSDQKLKKLQSDNNTILSQLLDLQYRIFKLPKLQDWGDPELDYNNLKEIRIEDLLQRSPIKLNNKRLSTLYENKTVLVTGAAGSIGSEIVRQLIPFKPRKILLIDQAETPLHILTLELSKDFPEIDYEKIIADVRNKKRIEQIFELFRPQVVFHAAAYKHVPMMEANAIESLSVNFQGTRNVSELACQFNIERFVFVSTDKAVNPTNIMGATKRTAELFIQSLTYRKNIQTAFITTRFGNVLGSNGSVIPHFKKQIAEGGPITVTHPDIIRYFMTIDEACQLVLEAGGMGHGGEIFVFDMGSPVKIMNLAKHMIRLSGLRPDRDIKIEITGLRPGEKLFEELLADKEATLTTHHEKIMIAKANNNFEKHELSLLLNNLLESVRGYECKEALTILKKLVPEYHKEDHPSLNKIAK